MQLLIHTYNWFICLTMKLTNTKQFYGLIKRTFHFHSCLDIEPINHADTMDEKETNRQHEP